MELEKYRKSVHLYITSLTFFKRLYNEKFLSKEQFDYFEVRLALKYGLPVNSIIRKKYKIIYF